MMVEFFPISINYKAGVRSQIIVLQKITNSTEHVYDCIWEMFSTSLFCQVIYFFADNITNLR